MICIILILKSYSSIDWIHSKKVIKNSQIAMMIRDDVYFSYRIQFESLIRSAPKDFCLLQLAQSPTTAKDPALWLPFTGSAMKVPIEAYIVKIKCLASLKLGQHSIIPPVNQSHTHGHLNILRHLANIVPKYFREEKRNDSLEYLLHGLLQPSYVSSLSLLRRRSIEDISNCRTVQDRDSLRGRCRDILPIPRIWSEILRPENVSCFEPSV